MSSETADLYRRLEALEAQGAIETLFYNYGHLLDFADPDAYAAQFTEDAILEIQSAFINLFKVGRLPYEAEALASGGERTRNGVAFRGQDALRRFVSKAPGPRRSLHVASQPIIELTGPKAARAASYMRVYAQQLDGPMELQGFGRYLDTLELTRTGWKFSHRICEI